jgi:methylmalonyl-CoA/ethylmalonyl-CoA epimerase
MGFTKVDTSGIANAQAVMGLTRYLHHVGIVVPIETRAAELMGLLGLEEWYRGYVERWQALCIFTKRRDGSPIEFVVPNGGFLKEFNRGVGGLHHVAFAVDSLASASEYLKCRGMSLVEKEPVKGAGPFLCNFLSPVYTRGITIEFVEEIDEA